MTNETDVKPLQGMFVLDFSQFLSGPSAGLRLADLGARVIKVERPGSGDICRTLYISNVVLDGDSSIFHAINRNKESVAADLKKEEDLKFVKSLIARADVMIQNFRPDVMERLGLHYDEVKQLNPSIVYGEVTGYGIEGPWKDTPGQDLLAQSKSGLVWLNRRSPGKPAPFGLAAADMLAGAHLAQGILSCLVRRSITGEGAHVAVSLLESVLDMQFQELSVHLNGAATGLANPALSINDMFETKNGYIAITGVCYEELAELLDWPKLTSSADPHNLLAEHFKGRESEELLQLLGLADIPCAEVLAWDRLMNHEGYRVLHMTHEIERSGSGYSITTTRCPIRIDQHIFTSRKGAPRIGEDTERLRLEANAYEC